MLQTLQTLQVATSLSVFATVYYRPNGGLLMCDHIMLILGNLYHIYTNLHICDRSSPDADDEDESHPVTRILESIKKQWLKVDQDLFLACFWLNPFVNPFLHNTDVLPVAVLMGIIQHLYS